MKRWMKIITVVSGLVATLILTSNWIFKHLLFMFAHVNISRADASSIGIIGGADGPTAIYLAPGNPPLLKYSIVAILYILTAIGIKNWRKETQR